MKSFKKFVLESIEQKKLDEKLKASDDMGDWVKDFQDSDAPQFKGKSQKKRQQMAIAAKLAAERNEEVELDEAVEVRHDRYMRSHGKKASGGTGSWMFTHKNMGDVDYNDEKQVYSAPRGKFSDAKKSAQQWAKKHGHSTVYVMEEVELDEVSTEKLRDYASAALQDKNKAKADKRWKYAGKAMQKVANREVKAAHDRKYNKMEAVEQLDEAFKIGDKVTYGVKKAGRLKIKTGKIIRIDQEGRMELNTSAFLDPQDKVSKKSDIKMHHDFIIESGRLDELSPKTLKSYSDKANKSLDRLEKQRDAVGKNMSKTTTAIGKRSAAEKSAHSATTQAQHNKATAAYRAADKGAKKSLAGHSDLVKQHSQLTKKINMRMDGIDRAYDKMHEEVELDESRSVKDLGFKTKAVFEDGGLTLVSNDSVGGKQMVVLEPSQVKQIHDMLMKKASKKVIKDLGFKTKAVYDTDGSMVLVSDDRAVGKQMVVLEPSQVKQIHNMLMK